MEPFNPEKLKDMLNALGWGVSLKNGNLLTYFGWQGNLTPFNIPLSTLEKEYERVEGDYEEMVDDVRLTYALIADRI